MNRKQDRSILSAEIRVSRKALLALGDETRQHIISAMIQEIDNSTGMRVGDIAALASLSRASVSQHLKILQAAGVVSVRRKGKKNYYYFNEDAKMLSDLIRMLSHAKDLLIRSAEESAKAEH